jgi:hypothetical protein
MDLLLRLGESRIWSTRPQTDPFLHPGAVGSDAPELCRLLCRPETASSYPMFPNFPAQKWRIS